MVVEAKPTKKCAQCKASMATTVDGWYFCPWFNMNVWGSSLMCKHGHDIDDIF